MVGKQFDVPVASPAEMALLYPFNAEQFRQLDNQANQLARTIRRGEFSRHNVPVLMNANIVIFQPSMTNFHPLLRLFGEI